MAGKSVDVLSDDFRYPDKPAPRAFGYLDNSGVEWAAYDTGQMEAYALAAVAEFLSGAGVVMEVREADGRIQCVWLGCSPSDYVGRAFIPYPNHAARATQSLPPPNEESK